MVDQNKHVSRMNFQKLTDPLEMPFLIDTQRISYEAFLKTGIKEVFKEVFPIESYDGTMRLDYVRCYFEKAKYDIPECIRRGLTFASPLMVKLRLRQSKDIREQDIYLGDIPLMTKTGTFVINGAERVVVNQLQRSPGLCFEKKLHPNGKSLYSVRIIPYRGAWLEFEFDVNDILYVVIDRRRKMLATTLLRCLKYVTDEEILKLFYETEKIKLAGKVSEKKIIGRILAQDVVDPKTKDILAAVNEEISKTILKTFEHAGVTKIELKKASEDNSIVNTLVKDVKKTQDEAFVDFYRRLRPGDPPSLESAKGLIHRMFFDPKHYDLARVGRFKLNQKLNLKNVDLNERLLRPIDIVEAIRQLISLKNGMGSVDDIDHLGNRRVRTVGELVQNQFHIGLARLERSIRERMSIHDDESVTPHNLINSKLVSSTIKDFFQRSQLSQFMDQVNPLSELTHKRRLSALGPGGLSRERAGFEVRDVHYTHYGRVCPIETPEGPNIGLISSLSTYARVNELGFIETPYRIVKDGVVTGKIDYLSADIEDESVIAQANAPLDEKGKFLNKEVLCRARGDFPKKDPKDIDYMDVSPKQLVSVAASLIPFLEHDDANRALMGSNMQRQAVPLLYPEEPVVGTGMEYKVAKDSGAMIIADRAGEVKEATSRRIVIKTKAGTDEYILKKFQRSNSGTCINQRPLVKQGDKVFTHQVIGDGPATKNGELALGQNVLVAFMPWEGYNFEDAIIVSERLIKDNIYTSIHVEEFTVEARDTKLGKEEITRDIPNVSEDALRNLDDEGIICMGAEVKPGDILVGKITPKSETELSPEEKLLRAIFGEKAGDVRDASLVVPPGVEGIVIGTDVFSRKDKGHTDDERIKEIKEIDRIKKETKEQIEEVVTARDELLREYLVGQVLEESLMDQETGNVVVPAHQKIKISDLSTIIDGDYNNINFKSDDDACAQLKKLLSAQRHKIISLEDSMERRIYMKKSGDELPPGTLKMVKVYVASKRKLSIGDKMAGRHGNKGVIAKILPQEDMPYLPDGTPVDIILNPLGVPSRMNVGQILETHLGWAVRTLGFTVATSVFDGASEKEIKALLKKANLSEDGTETLLDGRTGEPFDLRVTIGYIYMLKLAHLVDDKIHARSIGPYSLITQQPLGGKAQFGGQRFGEMEVWAMEAYGAAYTLQELLTVKSDDVQGRTRMYEAIVKGENVLEPGRTVSFNVLVKELQGLCLDLLLERKSSEKSEEPKNDT